MPQVKCTLLWTGAVAILATSACKPKPPVPVIKTYDGTVVERPAEVGDDEESAAAAIAQEASALEDRGDIPAAVIIRDELVEKYPGTQAGANELASRADLAHAAGNLHKAIALYQKVLFYRPHHARADDIRMRYVELMLEVGRHDDVVVHELESLYDHAASGEEKGRLGTMLAESLVGIGRSREALAIYVTVRSLRGVPAERQESAAEAAAQVVARRLSFSDAEALWLERKKDAAWAFLHPILAFKLAKIYYHSRDFERSGDMAEMVTTRYRDSPLASPARELLKRLRDRTTVDARAVGVLLPLSGRYKQYGERSLEAINVALGVGADLELIVKDTQGDPTAAAAAVQDLVLEDHVIAIVGPIFSKTALAAAHKAEELSVPILTLSFRDGLPQIGPWVFRTALTVEAQAKALARVAFEELGISRFALLYPRSRYGNDFVAAFWEEVDRRRGEIRGAESYEHDQKTFREPVRKLVGRWFLWARPVYLEGRRACKRKKLAPHVERRCMEDLEKATVPIVDFDAIVIPDSGRKLGLIAPAIAVEDVVLTRDPEELETIKKATRRTEVNPVTLMGASRWNTQQLLDSCERDCDEAIFVDAYFPDHPDPKVRDFVSIYREATGMTPHLSEAQAFDTAGMLRWILGSFRPRDRNTLRELLLQQTSYAGVTGPLRFDEHGEAQKDLFTLTVRERAIRLWTPPEVPPEG